MDAGWYPRNAWPETGTWEVDRERFPRGLKAISDYVHARGMELIVWFEPERVTKGSWLAEHHPEWILGDGKNRPGGTGGGLFNLGDPAAAAWMLERVDRIMTEEGVDLYRQDFNMDPLGCWRANDAADRQGITEIRHVTGYLAYWDELLRRHPGMFIDSCASGGRRNDLETLRRAVPLLRSDYQSFTADPGYAHGNQGHTYGLSAWIPYHGQGLYFGPDDFLYAARSYLSLCYGVGADVRIGPNGLRRSDVDWAVIRKAQDDFRRVAAYMLGDFYPLTAYSLDDRDWMAWQFDDPEAGAGMVQAFRRKDSPFLAARFPLHGLDPAATYEVTDLDAPGAGQRFTGKALIEDGLPVTITRWPWAVIFVYRRVRER
jgi:alpha-galactosidase